jgi:hypothetical protein
MSQDILPLASNGTVFVGPPCMAGVPIAKAVEGGPYWVGTWNSFDEELRKMESNLDAYELEVSRGEKAKRPMQPVHALSGLKEYFFHQGFHPNQLLAKKYITGSGLVQVDLLYKIKGIMEDLHEAYEVDVIRVKPLPWLRGRLAYVIDKQYSHHSLQSLLETFDKDVEFESVVNVRDMILRSPGHMRSKQLTGTKKDKNDAMNPNPNSKHVKKAVNKNDLRCLHQKVYLPAHVNRHMKQRYKEYQESQQGKRDKSYKEKNAGEDMDDDAEDDEDYVE